MSASNLSEIRAVVRQILRDEFVSSSEDYEWEEDELDVHISDCLREISRRSPRKVIEVLTTTANSKILDISSITDLFYIDKLEYPAGDDPRSFRNVIPIDEDTIEISVDATPIAGGSGTLTGTVTFTSGSTAVTGSGTDFDGELETGYHIRPSGGSGRWYRVYSITDDTTLTLAEPCRSADTGADTANLTEYCYETVYLYCAKRHTLSDTTSTLTPQQEEVLITGVCARAALSKSRSHINKVNKGSSVARDMAAWGTTQLALYRGELDQISVPRTKRRYPRD
jgi:hypothetical protein